MFSFDKARRLINKSDYNNVFSQAKKIVTPELIILYRENTLGISRLGLALSKKMIAKAHDRNRIKRIVRETFRQKVLPCVDMVVLARQGVGGVENKRIIANLGKSWEKLNTYFVP